jgi:hypothetical protein
MASYWPNFYRRKCRAQVPFLRGPFKTVPSIGAQVTGLLVLFALCLEATCVLRW